MSVLVAYVKNSRLYGLKFFIDNDSDRKITQIWSEPLLISKHTDGAAKNPVMKVYSKTVNATTTFEYVVFWQDKLSGIDSIIAQLATENERIIWEENS